MNHYYGQNAEDFLLRKIFPNRNGFFVEVGCIDGKVFSNTLFFEKLGWKGVCIEAHSGYIDMIKLNRPGSAVIHCAIGEKNDNEVTFYANSRGSLSSLDKHTEERWRRHFGQYFTGFEEQKVQKRTLTSVLDQLNVKHIDFMSIDIEGYEVQALQGLNLTKYRPTLILVESDSPGHKAEIEKILLPNGYFLILDYNENLFYSTNPAHRNIIANRNYYNIPVHRFAHPVDQDTDRTESISILLKRPSPSLYIKMRYIIKQALKKIGINLVRGSIHKVRKERELSPFLDIGFHGDRYLIEFVLSRLRVSKNFIETGTNVGSTLNFVARQFKDLSCFSCEPHTSSFAFAKSKTSDLSNVYLFNRTSPEFFYDLLASHPQVVQSTSVFWLDSHGHGFKWPLQEEVELITKKFPSAYIFIDDFKVPGEDQFLYDEYEGQICSFDYIKSSLAPGRYTLYYPNYKDRTSSHHPLKGWILIEYGLHREGIIPDGLRNNIKTEIVNT